LKDLGVFPLELEVEVPTSSDRPNGALQERKRKYVIKASRLETNLLSMRLSGDHSDLDVL
jgi:hypothetical protein